jgi:hypothetical protein
MPNAEGHTHRLRQGECISDLGVRHGLFPETIWRHAENEEIRQLRDDMNILEPGDKVYIPAIEERQEEIETAQKHRFRRKGVPAVVRIRLARFGKPFANTDYRIAIDGKEREGATDGDGVLEEPIPPSAKKARVVLELPNNEREEFEFDLGYQNPIDTTEGMQQRLQNLGYQCETTGETDDDSVEALKLFQQDHDLEVTGRFDERTRSALEDAHGS